MSLNTRILTVAQEVLARIGDDEAANTEVSIESGFPHRISLRRPEDEMVMSFAASEDGSHMIEVARQFDEGNRSVEHFKWSADEDEPEAVYSALENFTGALELESGEG